MAERPYELVRVKDAAGNKLTLSRIRAEQIGATILGDAATDTNGRPLPPKLAAFPRDVFDPAAHSAAEVVAYLEAADGNEVARVISVESDGKARTTITGWEAPTPAPES